MVIKMKKKFKFSRKKSKTRQIHQLIPNKQTNSEHKLEPKICHPNHLHRLQMLRNKLLMCLQCNIHGVFTDCGTPPANEVQICEYSFNPSIHWEKSCQLLIQISNYIPTNKNIKSGFTLIYQWWTQIQYSCGGEFYGVHGMNFMQPIHGNSVDISLYVKETGSRQLKSAVLIVSRMSDKKGISKSQRTIADKQLFANYAWAPEHRTGGNKLISLKGNMRIIISSKDKNVFLWQIILQFLETNSHVADHRDWFIISGLILSHSFIVQNSWAYNHRKHVVSI